MRREIWLIRHAESEWNAAGRWQGQADPELSERGRAQAAALARALAGAGIHAIVTSDLRRAAQTAHRLGAALALDPLADVRLRERHLGGWSGLTTDEIAQRWPDELARVRARDPDVRPGGGESLRDVAARLGAFLADLAARRGPERIALVTHGGCIRTLRPGAPIGNGEVVRARLGELLEALPRADAAPEPERL